MIQDIGVEQLKNEYHPKPPKDESRIIIFDAGKLLCRINEEMQIAYPKYGEWRKNKADEGTLISDCRQRPRHSAEDFSLKEAKSQYFQDF